jgi:hypothetical protein
MFAIALQAPVGIRPLICSVTHWKTLPLVLLRIKTLVPETVTENPNALRPTEPILAHLLDGVGGVPANDRFVQYATEPLSVFKRTIPNDSIETICTLGDVAIAYGMLNPRMLIITAQRHFFA